MTIPPIETLHSKLEKIKEGFLLCDNKDQFLKVRAWHGNRGFVLEGGIPFGKREVDDACDMLNAGLYIHAGSSARDIERARSMCTCKIVSLGAANPQFMQRLTFPSF